MEATGMKECCTGSSMAGKNAIKEGSKRTEGTEGSKEGRKGMGGVRKEGRKAARKEGRKDGSEEGRKEGRKEGHNLRSIFSVGYKRNKHTPNKGIQWTDEQTDGRAEGKEVTEEREERG